MSREVTLVCLLKDYGSGRESYVRSVLSRLDAAGLRFHYYFPGQYHRVNEGVNGTEISGVLEQELELASPERIHRATRFLIDSGGASVVDVGFKDHEIVRTGLLQLRQLGSAASPWLLELHINATWFDSAHSGEEPFDELDNAFHAFLPTIVIPLFDDGIALFGYAGVDLDDPTATTVTAMLASRIPDIYYLNIYPKNVLDKYGAGLLQRIGKEGVVIHESQAGTIVWRVSLGTDEFFRITRDERLSIFGVSS